MPVTFVTLHDDLVAILTAINDTNTATAALITEIHEAVLLENKKFEWLHDQDPLEIPEVP